MSNYAIFFDYKNKTYRLPTNPEEIEIETVQAVQRYEILKHGQIALPTHMELLEYSFKAEFPHNPLPYVETSGNFKNGDYYLELFKSWREALTPVRFIATNGVTDDINTLVLIATASIMEKAGEEGDKYISFKLLEYKEFGKKSAVVKKVTVSPTGSETVVVTKASNSPAPVVNPKSNGTYVVQPGDSLWSIAKKHYGDGANYSKIFSANQNIKNPSLIYPGQKLVIPS